MCPNNTFFGGLKMDSKTMQSNDHILSQTLFDLFQNGHCGLLACNATIIWAVHHNFHCGHPWPIVVFLHVDLLPKMVTLDSVAVFVIEKGQKPSLLPLIDNQKGIGMGKTFVVRAFQGKQFKAETSCF